MTSDHVIVRGLGVQSPAGCGAQTLAELLLEPRCCLVPLTQFPAAPDRQALVGQVPTDPQPSAELPRTHDLALAAAAEAVSVLEAPPDAVVLGITTGGLPHTEAALLAGETDPHAYRHHGLDTVTEAVARAVGCRGPRLTLSTACSSGAVALGVARTLLLRGGLRRVLAGGVDALCRLTFNGFSLLQVVDPAGARPLDVTRRGMTVAEGAAFLLLERTETLEPGDITLRGVGHSCDAHHATAPDPEGRGAAAALQAALDSAGVVATEIDYVNLHGTGTVDNDAAEARAMGIVFGATQPPASSIKGMIGHSLAASGAIEAATVVQAMQQHRLPVNHGLEELDPSLGLAPVRRPEARQLRHVLSSSLGFGGSNTALLFSRVEAAATSAGEPHPVAGEAPTLKVLAAGCTTAAGGLEDTWIALSGGDGAAGALSDDALAARLEGQPLRRLGRLNRLALAASLDALNSAGDLPTPEAVFLGTGWGALADTHDFLARLAASGGRFASPTQFSNSVHNAVAGQLAIWLGAKGTNHTTVARRHAFAQAALLAAWEAGPARRLLVGVDAWHEVLSPRLEVDAGAKAARDGAAALLVARGGEDLAQAQLRVMALGPASGVPLSWLPESGHAAVFLDDREGDPLEIWPSLQTLPRVALSARLGGHASLSGVATALAVRALQAGELPGGLLGGPALPLAGRGILVAGTDYVLAVEPA